jgi:hypothetical protein
MRFYPKFDHSIWLLMLPTLIAITAILFWPHHGDLFNKYFYFFISLVWLWGFFSRLLRMKFTYMDLNSEGIIQKLLMSSTIIPWSEVKLISFIPKISEKYQEVEIFYFDRGPVLIRSIRFSPADQALFLATTKRYAPVKVTFYDGKYRESDVLYRFPAS